VGLKKRTQAEKHNVVVIGNQNTKYTVAGHSEAPFSCKQPRYLDSQFRTVQY